MINLRLRQKYKKIKKTYIVIDIFRNHLDNSRISSTHVHLVNKRSEVSEE